MCAPVCSIVGTVQRLSICKSVLVKAFVYSSRLVNTFHFCISCRFVRHRRGSRKNCQAADVFCFTPYVRTVLFRWRVINIQAEIKRVICVCFYIVLYTSIPGGRGHLQTNWVGVCGPLPKTIYLFLIKVCDFPFPIFDLTKNSIPFFWPLWLTQLS